ncbi:hypothetical protein B9T27_13560 [Acinetobacter sp. ANC 4648]|nr:hypothetical protein B9T27_13560 [Acinetobacter sp. ANC 4648]
MLPRNFQKTVLFSSILLNTSTFAALNENTKQETANNAIPLLETIVVTASGYDQTVAQAPASITVIPDEELEKHSYTSLQDALRDVEGVTIAGGVKGEISIRGMPAEGTLILVDGRR